MARYNPVTDRHRATMSGHSTHIERRSGDRFFSIPVGAAVKPLEPVRYVANNASRYSPVTFHVDGPTGEVFRQQVASNLAENAFIDVAAPVDEGAYTLTADAFSLFSLFSHPATTTFQVSAAAPPPPPPPLGGFDFGNVKFLIFAALGVVGVMLVSQTISILPKRE